MHIHDTLYLQGRWVTPVGGRPIDVHSAATEEVIGRVPAGTEADAAAAVAAAHAAFDGWSRTTARERGACLRRIHTGLKARADALARTISAEVGMPLKLSARIQVGLPVEQFALYADLVERFPFEQWVGHSLVLREPAGVAACITPWNYPLHQAAAKVAPALAAGCTVVLKPAEVAPLSAFALAEVIHEAALPAGVFNLVSGPGPVVGEALVRHPLVDVVSFTGSTRAGRRVAALAADTLKRVTLELGGKSAAIVLDDADLAAAVKGVVASCFLNSGQTCSAHTRLLVPQARYAEAAALAVAQAESLRVGDPFDPATRIGPLASADQRERVRTLIATAMAEGAELLCGGPQPPVGLERGYYLRPTVFGRVRPGSTLDQEEVFGPVLAILTYRDEAEAVRIADGTRYGLSAGVWSADAERAVRLARRLRSGQVDINGAPFNIHAPFGGRKQSGYGREMGEYGLAEFLDYKALQRRQEI